MANKQVRREVLSVIFQGSAICVRLQIPRDGYGSFSEHTTSLFAINHILNSYPLLCDMAKQLSVFVDPERPYIHAMGEKVDHIIRRVVHNHFGLMLATATVLGPFIVMGYSAGRVYRRATTIYSRGYDDLTTFVEIILHRFKTCKSLKLIYYLDNLELLAVKTILRLFDMPNCSITLEEWWEIPRRGNMREAAREAYDERYKNLIPTAAEESGHKWFLLVYPSVERIYFQGVEDVMIRQRVWHR